MAEELRTIRLYGHLGKRFGRVHRRYIESPAEAVRALCATLPGFREYVQVEHANSAFRVMVGETETGAEELAAPSGAQEIRIVPVVRGGKSALGKIITGAVMIVAAIYGGWGAYVARGLWSVGFSIAAGGVSQLLANTPDPTSYKQHSYVFGGTNNVSRAGGAVPVLYGRREVPLTLVSGGITPENVGNCAFGIGDGLGTLTGDGNTVPRGASIKSDQKSRDKIYTGTRHLDTNEITRMLFAVSEGPIGGPVDALKSIKLEGTPIQNADGTFNFKGVAVAWVNGTTTQQAIPGFPSSETEHSSGAQITTTQPQYITVSDTAVNAVRVKIGFQSLQKIKKDGKAVGTKVQVAIDIQASGGSYATVLQPTISGLSESSTSTAFLVPLKGTGPWTLRIRRVTEDSTSNSLMNNTYLSGYTEIKNARLRFPNTAMLAVAVSAEQFSSVPTVALDAYGRVIQVPSNYNPTTRSYAGAWDGTFKDAWTDNPVWCFLDMATHTRYGARVPASSLDKWGLYEVAQYCDGMVSDGQGGTEPRYRFSYLFSDEAEAFKVLAHMVGAARAALYYGGTVDRPSTALTVVQDRASTPRALFSPSNVIDGGFNYAGTPRKTRYTQVTVWWHDPAQGYAKVPVIVRADASWIARYGLVEYETEALGCTSKGQAIREGRRIIYTSLLETETVSFETGMEGIVAFPGDVIAIQDPGRDRVRMAGRLASATTTTLTLDAPVTLESGKSYTAWVQLADGSIVSRAVSTGAGVVSAVTLTTALQSAPQPEAQWHLTASAPTLWRLVKVAEKRTEDSLTYECTAVAYNPSKFALLDDCGTVVNVTAASQPRPPVTGLVLTSRVGWADGSASFQVSAKWEPQIGATGYRAVIRQDDSPWQEMQVDACSAVFSGLGPGVYDVEVVARYPSGVSHATTASILVENIPATTPATLAMTISSVRPA